MAQLVISAAGAAAGFALGGPLGAQIGWVAGSALGSVIAPQRQRVEGPRLSDLKVTGSAYGAPIPYVEGHPRVAGQIVWSTDKYPVSSTTTSGGKGGPSVETVNTIYKIDCLVLLTANPIAGVRRIWSNGALVWTSSDAATGDSLLASDATAHWDEITVYTGAASQLPDPIYEAAVGSGNAPAYRGRGTVMIEGLNLGNSGQLPNLTFEVVQQGTVSTYSTAILYAPLENDDDDVIAPAATVTLTGPAGISYDGTRVTLDADSAGTNVAIRYAEAKLYATAYAGQHITMSVRAAIVSSGGNDTSGQRFFLYNHAVEEVGFYSDKSGGVVRLWTWAYGVGVSELVGTMPSDAVYSIVLDADGHTVRWYVDGVLVRTASGTHQNGIVIIQCIDSSSFAVRAMAFSDLQFYVGDEPYTTSLIDAPSTALSTVVENQCVRGGLDAAQVDVTALAALEVRSLAVANVTPPRSVIELLALAYHFECVESLGVLKFVLRGGASAATIPYASMGATQGGQPAEPLPLRLANDVETPAQIIVRHVNVSADYQDGSESSDRLLGASRAVQTIEVPLGLTPTEARQLADVHVMDVAASQRTFGPVALSNDYAHLEPTDVVTLTDVEGQTYRARILRMTSAGGGLHTIEGVIEDATILDSDAATTTDGYTDSDTVTTPTATAFELLDIPLLRDADDGPGFYIALQGTGCVVYGSPDDVTYTAISTVLGRTQIGECTTTLGAWAGGTVFDETNTVTVDVGAAETLQSWSRDDILSGAATGYVIGDELIYARTATLSSPGVYVLSGLLRGRRGTEWAMAGHGSGERCVALTAAGAGLLRVALSTSDIGVTRYYKAVTFGLATSTVDGVAFACAGVSQKPFAPVDLRASVSDSAVTVDWKRRTRYATRFTGTAGISVPLGETVEAYTVELRDAGSALVSTETVTEPSWSNGSAVVTAHLVLPARLLRAIGGELVGIRDDQLGNASNPNYLIRFTADGALTAQGGVLCTGRVEQWDASGDDLYVASSDINWSSTPAYYTAGHVRRYARTDLATVLATYTSATPGDPAGVACDGTSVWMTENQGDNLRKLNASTLASVATYPMGAEQGRLYHDAGTLWMCSVGSDEVVQWDIATTSDLLRIGTGFRPLDLVLTASRVFVQLTGGSIEVYNSTSGASVATPSIGLVVGMCLFGADVAVIVSDATTYIVILDGTTGAVTRTIRPAQDYLYAASSPDGTTLYVTSRDAGVSAQTDGYELSTAGLSGYSLTVAQQGAVGDGYSASITL